MSLEKRKLGKLQLWKLVTLEKFNSGNDCFCKKCTLGNNKFGTQQVWNVHGPSRPPYFRLSAYMVMFMLCVSGCFLNLILKP